MFLSKRRLDSFSTEIGVGEVTARVSIVAAFPEDLSSVPDTQIGRLNNCL